MSNVQVLLQKPAKKTLTGEALEALGRFDMKVVNFLKANLLYYWKVTQQMSAAGSLIAIRTANSL